jgi:hypothetical protein
LVFTGGASNHAYPSLSQNGGFLIEHQDYGSLETDHGKWLVAGI